MPHTIRGNAAIAGLPSHIHPTAQIRAENGPDKSALVHQHDGEDHDPLDDAECSKREAPPGPGATG